MGNRLTVAVMFGMVFMVGFVTMFTGPLAAVVKAQFGASNALSQFGSSANFLAYLFMGIPCGMVLKRRGYRFTSLAAVTVGIIGVALQILAGFVASFGVYVAGAFVAGLSMCMLNTAANPLLNTLGGGGNGGNRLVQYGCTFNSVGGMSSPLIIGFLVGNEVAKANVLDALPVQAAALAFFVFGFFAIRRSDIPEPHLEQDAPSPWRDIIAAFGYRHFALGALAMFLFVPVECGICNMVYLYLTAEGTEAYAGAVVGGATVSAYCALMMVGRFGAGLFGRRVSPRAMVGVSAAAAIALLAAAATVPFAKFALPFVSLELPVPALLMVACGLCISVMFGGIFNLATEGLGRLVPVASGVTMSLVSGGALLAAVGVVTDRFGILSSCWVFALFLGYILFFSVAGSRIKAAAAVLLSVTALSGASAAGAPGDPSGWIEVTPQNGVWDEYYARTADPGNCSFRFRVSRYSDSLGVEAFVRDDKVVVDNCRAGDISCETWKDDCLEVFFDGDNDRNPNTRGPEYETKPVPCNAGGEYAITANGATQSDYASSKKCFGRLWGGVAEPWMEGSRRIGTHYRLWFRYECLGRPVPRPDEDVTFGFTICVHDDDDGGANDLALYWKGNPKIPYADESAFGSFTFRGRRAEGLDALVPVDWSHLPPEKGVAELRRLYGLGFRRFVLIGPWTKRYCGRADVDAYAQTGRDIAYAKDALEDLPGVEIGWWLAPSMGNSRDFPGQRLMDCDGNVTFASCPLSDDFADALAERVEACVGRARPAVVFVEDDYTLSNHGGLNKMKGCFCPLHLAEYAKRARRTHSAAEIAAMFRNPTAGNAAMRRAFAELSRDSLARLASRIRAAIDRVDPSIRVCLCQSGFVDIDGDSTETVARAFAGSTRPMVRIFGAGYFAETPARIPAEVSHAVWSAQHISPDVELIHETDPYPHTRFYNSSLYLFSELSAAVMAGVDGSYYYCTQYQDDPLGDPGYALKFKRESRRLEEVRCLRATMRPCGVGVVYDPAEVYMFRETEKGAASGMLPVGAYFLSKMGLPMMCGDGVSAALLVGSAPNGLSDAQIGSILSGGVLVDAEAAVALSRRGFGDLMGCEAAEQPADMFYEHEEILPVAGCRSRGRRLYNRRYESKPIIGWTPKKSVTAKLSPGPGTQELSALFDIDGRKVAPATLFFKNAKGGRVGVMCRSLDAQPHPSIYSERKQELLIRLFERLSGGSLDVSAPATPGTWLLAARNERELLVMAENLCGEPRDDFALRFSPEWEGASVSRIALDGSRERLGAASREFRLPPGSLPPTTPEFFVVTKRQPADK
jgi:FHS family L-fucose permease-like MFS transporter